MVKPNGDCFFPLKQQYTIEEKLNPSPAADGPMWQSRAIFIQFCLPFAFSASAFVKIRSAGFVLSCLKLLWQMMQVGYPNFHFQLLSDSLLPCSASNYKAGNTECSLSQLLLKLAWTCQVFSPRGPKKNFAGRFYKSVCLPDIKDGCFLCCLLPLLPTLNVLMFLELQSPSENCKAPLPSVGNSTIPPSEKKKSLSPNLVDNSSVVCCQKPLWK